jgi:hypothetical protein
MSTPASITVNGFEYVPKLPTDATVVKVVILQRGWVMVGRYVRDGDNCKLYKASVIRNWGTTKGLGEIASGGPTSSTKLEPTNGIVEFHRLTEIGTIECVESKWTQFLI